jgi:hypothetical protein
MSVPLTSIQSRFSGYGQWSRKDKIGSSEVWYNAGVRIHNWEVTGADVSGSAQTTFSPRAQFAIKPDWEKDMVFRFSGGLYHQPPFYRELRDAAGVVQPNVKAQQPFILLSNDYSFKMWDRPFKLVSSVL